MCNNKLHNINYSKFYPKLTKYYESYKPNIYALKGNALIAVEII